MERFAAVVLALILLVGCDRGVEANSDNLSHFASVTSELRRDSRELVLLAKKVAAVRGKLERRRAEIAEHTYTDEMGKHRDALLERFEHKADPPAPNEAGTPSDPATPATPSESAEPPSDALVGVIMLHDQLFGPLRVYEDSLGEDVDYGWWIDELGLASADASLVSQDTQDEHHRAVDDCRTMFDGKSRAAACKALLVNHTTSAYFAQVKQQWLGDLDTEIARLSLIETEFQAEAADRQTSAAKVMDAYGSSFDGLIIWGFPALIVAVLIIVLFEGRRRKASPDAPTLDTVAVVTVLLLVSAIIILGLGGKIAPEALGTLIGGISGYVLGKGAQALIPEGSAQPKVAAATGSTSSAASTATSSAAPAEPDESAPEQTLTGDSGPVSEPVSSSKS